MIDSTWMSCHWQHPAAVTVIPTVTAVALTVLMSFAFKAQIVCGLCGSHTFESVAVPNSAD